MLAQQCRHVHAGAISIDAGRDVGWMWVGMVAFMAKVIEFYVPDRLRERQLGNPPEQPGKVIKFAPKGIPAVTSELNDTKPSSCSQSMVPLTPIHEKQEETYLDRLNSATILGDTRLCRSSAMECVHSDRAHLSQQQFRSR
jgi:hypothetical protein